MTVLTLLKFLLFLWLLPHSSTWVGVPLKTSGGCLHPHGQKDIRSSWLTLHCWLVQYLFCAYFHYWLRAEIYLSQI